jgi:hypothetical protein
VHTSIPSLFCWKGRSPEYFLSSLAWNFDPLDLTPKNKLAKMSFQFSG